jgi:hypothetical protein
VQVPAAAAIRLLERSTDIREIRPNHPAFELERERAKDTALQYVLILLEEREAGLIERRILDRLQAILFYPGVPEFILNRLHSAPLDAATIDWANQLIALDREHPVASLLQEVLDAQPAIRNVRLAWDAVSAGRFPCAREKDQFFLEAVENGLVRNLAGQLVGQSGIRSVHEDRTVHAWLEAAQSCSFVEPRSLVERSADLVDEQARYRLNARAFPSAAYAAPLLTCRSISPAIWEHARNALVFHFSRTHGLENAEDLAHVTLAALWSRPNCVFEREEDFLRLCRSFADHLSKAAYRKRGKPEESAQGVAFANPDLSFVAGLNAVETDICLQQVIRIAESEMYPKEWMIVRQSLVSDRSVIGEVAGRDNADDVRMRLRRAIRKLAKLVARDKARL